MAKKSNTQKAIEKRGWNVRVMKNGVRATKKGLKVEGATLSDVRFFIRFEKFYKGSDVSVKGKK